MSFADSQGRSFARVLQPPEPWASEAPDASALQAEFVGRYPNISIFDTSLCDVLDALAAFYGASTRPGPVEPACLVFHEADVTGAGGVILKTDAHPPWPPAYNDAHHDIVLQQAEVAARVILLWRAEPTRRVTVDRFEMLALVFTLDTRADVPPSYRDAARKRCRRLFREERELWDRLADHLPHLYAYVVDYRAGSGDPS